LGIVPQESKISVIDLAHSLFVIFEISDYALKYLAIVRNCYFCFKKYYSYLFTECCFINV